MNKGTNENNPKKTKEEPLSDFSDDKHDLDEEEKKGPDDNFIGGYGFDHSFEGDPNEPNLRHQASSITPSVFTLKLDSRMVMAFNTDQLLKMTQLQGKLKTCSSLAQAKQLIKSSAFFKSLSLDFAIKFKESNQDYFDPLPQPVFNLLEKFVDQIVRKPTEQEKQMLPNQSQDESEAEAPAVEHRNSRSYTIKPRGSKVKGTLENTPPYSRYQSDAPAKEVETLRSSSLQFNPVTSANPPGHRDSSASPNNYATTSGQAPGETTKKKSKLNRQILQNIKAYKLLSGGSKGKP